jgi:energy-coupling factor transport system permease protein
MDLLRSLPIGLYLEQPVTWLHHLDARVKMAWLVSILVTPILANAHWRFFLVALLILLTLVASIPSAGLAATDGLADSAQQSMVMLLTFVMPDGLSIEQTPRMPTPTTMAELDNPPETLPELPQPTNYRYVVVDWGPITVTRRSLELGIRIGTLLFTLIYGTNLYLLTTAPEEITLALEALMKPLRWLGLPVTEIALTVTLSLRFIPLVLEEVQNLVRSVQTRAINWKKLGFRGSAQVWLMVVERLSGEFAAAGRTNRQRLWRCEASPALTNIRCAGINWCCAAGTGLPWACWWCCGGHGWYGGRSLTKTQPWYVRSCPLQHRTGADVFQTLYGHYLHQPPAQDHVVALLESPYPLPDAAQPHHQHNRYSICAGPPRQDENGHLKLWTPASGEAILPTLAERLGEGSKSGAAGQRSGPSSRPAYPLPEAGWVGWGMTWPGKLSNSPRP